MQPHNMQILVLYPLSGLFDYYSITGTNPLKVDAVVDAFMAMYNRLSAEDQSCLIPKM